MSQNVENGITVAKLAQVEQAFAAKRAEVLEKFKDLKVSLAALKGLAAQRQGLKGAIDEAQIDAYLQQMEDWIQTV